MVVRGPTRNGRNGQKCQNGQNGTFTCEKPWKWPKSPKIDQKWRFWPPCCTKWGLAAKVGYYRFCFCIARFFGSKKAIFGNFWPTCGLHAKWAQKGGGKYQIWAPKVTFFGKFCVLDLGVSNSEKWRFVHRSCRNKFWKSSNLHFFSIAGLLGRAAAGLSRIGDGRIPKIRKNGQNPVKTDFFLTF